MKQKNFILEVVECPKKRTFIIRELSPVPNMPAIPCMITDNPEEVAMFFGSFEFLDSSQEC